MKTILKEKMSNSYLKKYRKNKRWDIDDWKRKERKRIKKKMKVHKRNQRIEAQEKENRKAGVIILTAFIGWIVIIGVLIWIYG